MPASQRIWSLAQRARSQFLRKYSRLFFRDLNRQVIPVLKALSVQPYTKVLPKIDQLIKGDQIAKDYIQLYTDVAPKFARTQFNQLAKSYQQDINTKDDLQDQWLAAVREFVRNQSGERIVSVTETSRELCLQVLTQELEVLINEGLGVEELTRKLHAHLKKEWPQIQRWRARRIAQTEVLTASNFGQFQGADATGFPLLKIWIATADTATRDNHLAMLSHPAIPKAKRFDVGGDRMLYPGDNAGSAENVINCRCTTAYQVDQGES